MWVKQCHKYGLYMVNSTQTWLIYRGNSPLVCENNVIMWVKQCHKPPPSHHSFYRWYKPFPNGWFVIVLRTL